MTSIPPWLTRTVVGTALIAGAAGLALALAGVNSPLRVPLLLLFLVVAPAVAVTGLLRGFDPLAVLVIGGAAPIAMNSLVAATMATLGVWSPHAGLLAVAAITALLLAAQVPAVRALVTGRLPARRGRRAARAAGGRAPGQSRRARQREANAADQAAGPAAAMWTDDAATQIGAVPPLRAKPAPVHGPQNRGRPAAPTDAATAQFSVFSPAERPAPRGGLAGHSAPRARRDPGSPSDAATAQFSVIRPDEPAASADEPAAQPPAARPAESASAEPASAESASANDDPTAQFPAVRPGE